MVSNISVFAVQLVRAVSLYLSNASQRPTFSGIHAARWLSHDRNGCLCWRLEEHGMDALRNQEEVCKLSSLE